MQETKRQVTRGGNDDIVLSDYLRLIFRNFHWVVIACIVCLSLAYIKLRYEDKVYQSSGSIKIESDNNNLLSEVSVFKEMNPKDKVLTETYIVKSKKLIMKACEKLPIQVSYFSKGRVVNKELYVTSPFYVNRLNPDSLNFDKLYEITIHNNKEYSLSYTNESAEVHTLRGRFDDTVNFDYNRVQIVLADKSIVPHNTYNFVFNSPKALYARISHSIDVSQADKGVSLLVVNYKDIVPEFARDFINMLFKVYIDFDVEIKSQTATQTIEFMETLIRNMDTTVKGSEQNMEDFKKLNNVFDIDIKGESNFKSLTELETQQRLLQLQMLANENLENQINENKANAYLPLSIEGAGDPYLIDLLGSLNRLNLERISRSEKVTPNNPSSVELEKQIDELRRAIKQNIHSARVKILSQMAYLRNQIEGIQQGMRSLPGEEKQLITLKRDLEVNQKVYGFLLQTRLEAAISRASIVSSARVIDEPETDHTPVAPNKRTTYVLFMFLGVLLSILGIFLSRFLNRRLYTVDEIESISDIPIIGSVLAFPQKLLNTDSRMLALKEQRSIFGESIRTVRTNLQFLLPGKEKKVITITSTISGEGKTFSTINLAGSLTMLDKKVVLIGCDLRKPQLETTFNNKNKLGLSSYLAGTCSIDDVINKTDYENLSLIFSGPIPPNPAELLHSDRMKDLLDKLKDKFDYILLDTSPVGLVADAIVLIKMSDIVIYVVKAGYSKREYLELPQKLKSEHELSHIYLLLNSYKTDKLLYGGYGGYGYYGYGEDYYVKIKKKPFNWKQFFGLRR